MGKNRRHRGKPIPIGKIVGFENPPPKRFSLDVGDDSYPIVLSEREWDMKFFKDHCELLKDGDRLHKAIAECAKKCSNFDLAKTLRILVNFGKMDTDCYEDAVQLFEDMLNEPLVKPAGRPE